MLTDEELKKKYADLFQDAKNFVELYKDEIAESLNKGITFKKVVYGED